MLSSLYAECAPDPALQARYLETVVEPSRQAVGRTLDRAITRGDLRADADRDQLLDIVGALVHYRALFGREHLTDAEAESAIETLLRGAAVDYPALVAHSEAMEQVHPGPAGAHHIHLTST